MKFDMKMYDNFDLMYNTSSGEIQTNENITMRIAFDKNIIIKDPYLALLPANRWDKINYYTMSYEKEENGYNLYKVEFSIEKAGKYEYFFKLTKDGMEQELKRTEEYNCVLNHKGWLYQLNVYENYYDNFSLKYKNPSGAVPTNEKITIRISFEKNTIIKNPFLVLLPFNNWNELKYYAMGFEKEEDGLNWYKVEFSIESPRVYNYFFKFNKDGVDQELKRTEDYKSELNHKGCLYQLTIYENNFEIEHEYLGGIMYQILPDRYCNSGIHKENIPSNRILRNDWGGMPVYLPDENKKIKNNDFFGGDIRGIIQKLDFIKEFGFTSIYLNPIFLASENHRYDTVDYFEIDPLLGTEEDFVELCAEAKKRDIVIILDGVFSHTGSNSKYFNKYNMHNTVGAYNSKESKYYNWYYFKKFPDEYESWFGIDTLPVLNKENSEYIDFICGDNGVICKWLKAGAYGFRLDVADDLPPKFLTKIKEAVVKYGGKILIGEVWEDASTKEGYGGVREYLLGKQLDSVMNYPFKNCILNYVRYGNWQYFYQTVMSITENYPKEVVDCLMNFLSTHDTERAITKLIAEEVGEPWDGHDRHWQAARNTLSNEQYELGKKRLKIASIIQYFLPGIPCVYYGEGSGVYGYKDPFNRVCYPWGKEDKELISFFKKLGKLRIENKLLKKALFRILHVNSDICVFERFNKTESIVVVVNRTDNYKNISFIKSISEYEKIATFGQNYKDYWLGEYSAVIFKKSNLI